MIHFFPFSGVFTAASHSAPLILSLSERPPSERTSIALAEASDGQLVILISFVRTDGVVKQLGPLVSDGVGLQVFMRIAVAWLEGQETFAGTVAAHPSLSIQYKSVV